MMSEKLRAVRARIENILGIEHLEFDLGKWTLVKGPNGVGKTATLEAVRSLFKGAAHDATILKKGAKRGETWLLLSDGVELAKQVLVGKTLLSVKVPKLGEISRAPGYVKGLTGDLSLNPVEFITAKPERQKELFLRAQPMRVTREQLEAAVGFPIKIPNLEGHAFDVLAVAEKLFYDDRTNVNRTLKQKEAAVQQLATSLPKAPPEGDWTAHVKQAERELRALDAEHRGRKQQVERASVEEIIELGRDVDAQTVELRRIAQVQIREIERVLMEHIEGLRQVTAQLQAEKRDALKGMLATIDSEISPQYEACVQKAEHARTMADQYIAAESARNLLAQYQNEAKALDEEAQGLTHGLEGLRALRSSLTAELPIPGVTVGEQELEVDGIPLSRVEESRKVTLAVELAMLGAGELPLIVVDGIEALDAHTLQLFKQVIGKYDAQVLAARVEDPDPTRPETLGLTVERED